MTTDERPSVDDAFRPVLDLMNAPSARPMSSMTPVEARESFRLLNGLFGPPVDGLSSVDRTVPGPAGDIPVRVVTPDVGEPVGILVWFHGGGFVIGDLSTADDMTRRLASATRCVVVSVDYRLAPEHPAPAASEDCWAVLSWVDANRGDLASVETPVAVGGDSAGGNLAAVTALRAASEGGPELAAQLLVYPVVDFLGDYPSAAENGEGLFLTTDTMDWFGQQYLSGGADPTDPFVAPVNASDEQLERVAPAIIHVAGYDPLRDQGHVYAARLADLGVTTEIVEYPTMIHGFYGMTALTPVAGEAIADAARALGDAFSSMAAR